MEVEQQQSFGLGGTVSETQLQPEAVMEDVPDETELQESQQPAGQMQEHDCVPAPPPPPPPPQQQAELQAASAPARNEPQNASLRAEEAVDDEEAALQRQRPAAMELDGASGSQQADPAAAGGRSGNEQQLEQDADAALPPAEAGDANK